MQGRRDADHRLRDAYRNEERSRAARSIQKAARGRQARDAADRDAADVHILPSESTRECDQGRAEDMAATRQRTG